MENILLPTDLFIRMQDWDLDTDAQLLFLALIINRPVNMTGVYVMSRREMRHQIPARDNDGRRLNEALEKLIEKKLVYYDDNVLFIPLIPETSRYSKHVFRHRMQRQVDRMSKDRPSNSALRAFQEWCAAHIPMENETEQSTNQTEANSTDTSMPTDKYLPQGRQQTLAEKRANQAQNGRNQATRTADNSKYSTDKLNKRLQRGSGEAPESLTRAPSSSSSLSSSYYSRRSTGIDVKGGAGEKRGPPDFEIGVLPRTDIGIGDSNEFTDDEESDYG